MKNIGKTLLAALLALALLAGCASGNSGSSSSAPESQSAVQGGTFTVTGSGYGGDVTVDWSWVKTRSPWW